jgi:hypothetical protein
MAMGGSKVILKQLIFVSVWNGWMGFLYFSYFLKDFIRREER